MGGAIPGAFPGIPPGTVRPGRLGRLGIPPGTLMLGGGVAAGMPGFGGIPVGPVCPAPGIPGRPGIPGMPGIPGKPGKLGSSGRPGRDGSPAFAPGAGSGFFSGGGAFGRLGMTVWSRRNLLPARLR